MKVKCLIIAMLLFPVGLLAQSGENTLMGEWTFGLDPVDVGIERGWYKADFPTQGWDKVTVPHCFTVDPRYHYFTGTAWYFKRFSDVALPEDYRAFIRFEAVFYKAQVWLNGKLMGEHEGGYTPFELDVTEALSDENVLALRVNNAWDTTTIPGAKTQVPYQSANMAQMYPWMNYGGITREVKLLIRPATFIKSVRVVATPDLEKKTADLHIVASIHNAPGEVFKKNDLHTVIYQSGKKVPVRFKITEEATVNDGNTFRMVGRIAAKDVELWHIDNPVVYEAELIGGKDTVKTTFGIRKIEIRGTEFLVNGEPVSLGGCNRPLDYPGYGSMAPPEVLKQDLTLIKSAGMELSRISHYPVSTHLLDWADRHGLLIIAEAGNWQMTPKQLSDPVMRKKFQSQMREMVERDRNHPSVIGWSVGNEYQSQTEEGKAWTRDMYAFVKSLDPSRPVTFSSNIVGRESIRQPEDEASQYVDFISVNIYGNHLKTLQHVHDLYPGKPVYVSEFGIRTDGVESEEGRIDYLKKAMRDFRQCDFLMGASVWTFNDYQSSFPLSNANGYRPWGVVSPEREPRGMYYAWKEEFAPAIITVENMDAGTLKVQLAARKDFPSYTLRDYALRVSGQSFDVALLKPGESKTFTVDLSKNKTADKAIALVKPGGFVILETEY